MAVLGFANVFILIRFLSLEDFGCWMIYMSAISFFEMLRSGLFQGALISYLTGEEGHRRHWIGSSWVINLSLSAIYFVVLTPLLLWSKSGDSLYYIALYYPFLSLINLPQTMACTILQSDLEIGRQMQIRLINLMFCLTTYVWAYYMNLGIEELILLHLAANLLCSIYVLFRRWSGILSLRFLRKKEFVQLLHFGKFSFGTLIGSNLLKSADTFLIAAFLGEASAAIYAIPLKATESFEILLRSVSNVALPRFSTLWSKGHLIGMKLTLQRILGGLLWTYLGLGLLSFVFADEILYLICGYSHEEMVWILRIFTLHGLLLPLDRLSGITLDCIRLPHKNMLKVLTMLAGNVILDLLFLLLFEDLKLVAVATVTTTFVGVLMGLHLLRPHLSIELGASLKSGWKWLRRSPFTLIKS